MKSQYICTKNMTFTLFCLSSALQCYNDGHLILNCVLNWSLFSSPTQPPGLLLCPTWVRRSCRWELLSTDSAAWRLEQPPWRPAGLPAGHGGSSRHPWPTPPGLYPGCHHCRGRSYAPKKRQKGEMGFNMSFTLYQVWLLFFLICKIDQITIKKRWILLFVCSGTSFFCVMTTLLATFTFQRAVPKQF